jgi:AraC-like DNA-binding protein
VNVALRFGITSVLCFTVLMAYPGVRPEDSLKTVLKTAQNDTVKFNTLIKIIEFYSEKAPDSTKFYLDKGRVYLAKLPPYKTFARYYHLNADYLTKMGNYTAAQQVLMKSLRLDDSLGLDAEYFSDRDMLATIHSRMGDQQKAIAIAKSLLPVVKKLNDNKVYVKYYTNLAIFYIYSGKMDTAALYFHKAYSFTRPGTFHRAAVAVNLAFLNYNIKKFNETIRYGKEAAGIAKKLRNNQLYLEALTNISNAYYELGEYDRAIFYSTKVMKLAKAKTLKLQLDNAYGNLAMAYEGKKDYKNALAFEKKYVNLHDSLFNDKMGKQINELEIKYETEKKDKALALKQNKIRVRNIELFSLLTGFLLLIVAAVFIFRLYRKRNKAYLALVQKQMDIMACEAKENPEKYKDSSLSDYRKEEISRALETAMKKDRLFLSADLTLGKLSSRLGINSKYLSQAIHEIFGESSTDYINRHRINEASRLLLDPAYAHISIEGIAHMVGFGSKSTFNAAFKKFTGVTPSFFMNAARTMQQNQA